MLDKNTIIEKMKSHFAKWMDIRKRVNTSKGGKLLISIAETIEDINQAIIDYKKDFFIDGYFGREDNIVDIIYKLNVGTNDNLVLTTPSLSITEDVNTFFNNKIAYYHNGIIYIKRTDAAEPKLKYSINNIEFNEAMEEYHVWNIFDEFATFVGLQRHSGETNVELEKRILNVFEDRVNSSETGLKNAIINELLVYDPNITKDDIKVERPLPENLVKYYNDFQTVLEYLEYFNHDTYRAKVWDIDIWEHTMAKIDYLPHAWDIAIENYQNGIGFEDDLKVNITNPDKATNVTLNMYIKDKDTAVEYFKTGNLNKTLPISFKKYNDNFEAKKAQYRIKASKAVDITDKAINIEYYNNRKDYIKYALDSLIDETNLNNINIDDNRKIDGDAHRLIFNADANGIFEVKKADLITSTLKESILKENDNFIFRNNSFVYKGCRALLRKTYDFDSSTDMTNVKYGISGVGTLKFNIDNMNSESIDVKFDCPLVDMLISNISTDFIYNDGSYTAAGAASLNIDGNYNQVSLDISGNNYSIIYTINGVSGTLIKSGQTTFKTDLFKNPTSMSIRIVNLGTNIEVSNIKYSSFNINLSCDTGNIVNNILPNIDNNNLTVAVTSNTVELPVINYIYIGEKCGLVYTVDMPESNQDRYLDIDTVCQMTLYSIQNEILNLVDNDFKPYKNYIGLASNSYVKLNLDNYTDIEEIDIENGHIEVINSKYFLFIDKDMSINSLYINGTTDVKISTVSLKTIVGAKDYDKLYITELVDGIIIKSGTASSIFYLTKDKLLKDNSVQYKVNGPDDILYLINTDGLNIKPKYRTISIATNEYNVFKPVVNDIDTVNTFYPVLDIYSNLCYYKIEALSDCEVLFGNGLDWNLGLDKITITSKNNSILYDEFTIDILMNFSNSNVINIDPVYETNSKVVKSTECILTPPKGCSVYYRKRSAVSDIMQGIQSEPEFYFTAKIIITDDGFNKLNHSNIDEILYAGSTPWNNVNSGDINDYTLLKDEGIIEWNNYKDNIGNVVYLLYTIKIPSYLDIDDVHLLYDKAEYVFNSYKLLHKFNFYNLIDGQLVDINSYNEYKTADKILAECSEPGFDATIKNGILTIKALSATPKIAVKTGYYYDSGNEYYLFNSYDKNANKVENTDYYTLNNIDVVEGQMKFHERAMNMVSNSSLEPSYLFNTVNINFNKNYTEGISRLNAITACDSLNFWSCLGQTLKLVPGYNDLGIEFTNTINDGYSFINITDGCKTNEVNAISLYARGDRFNIYIGRSKDNGPIEIIKTLNLFADNLYGTAWNVESDYDYYLIVSGACVVDDIILCDIMNKDIHIKNITMLELVTNEISNSTYNYSIFPNSQGAYIDGLKIEKGMFRANDLPINTITLQSIKDKNSYQECILENLIIDNNLLVTDEINSGSILTPPIYIRNFDKLEKVSININNIMFESMKNFPITIYGSTKVNNNYVKIGSTVSNNLILSKTNLMPYIKIKIDVPAGKIIDSIKVCAKYTDAIPVDTLLVYMSKIYDAEYSGKYILNSINVSSISNINDVDIWIRAAKNNYDGIFMDWKLIKLDDKLSLANKIEFEDARFFQIKVQLKNSSGYIQLNNIDLEMI